VNQAHPDGGHDGAGRIAGPAQVGHQDELGDHGPGADGGEEGELGYVAGLSTEPKPIGFGSSEGLGACPKSVIVNVAAMPKRSAIRYNRRQMVIECYVSPVNGTSDAPILTGLQLTPSLDVIPHGFGE